MRHHRRAMWCLRNGIGRALLASGLALTIGEQALRAQSLASNVDWSGVYVGAHAGAFGGSTLSSVAQPDSPTVSSSTNLFHAYDLIDGSGSQFAGLTLGYNHLWRSGVLYGVEGDATFRAEPLRIASPFDVETEALGTLRGRAGYATGRALYYATAGLAWTHDVFTAPDGSETTLNRAGFTVGAGIETALTRRWTAKAEYLYSRFGDSDLPLPAGGHLTSDLSLHQVRAGLNYRLLDPASTGDGRRGIVALELGNWSVHGQTTFLEQYAPPFHAPYSGANSLASNAGKETWDATLYAGRRLWKGGELWLNPEVDQGFGLSNTLGVAGFTSGEAYKVGYTHPYLRVPRVMVRQTINLGGSAQNVEAGINQFAGSQTANRLVITGGRYSVSDLFDTITYAHDPRNDFMNWSLADAGTFDYAADAWGFTYGVAAEWYQGSWTARGGFFDLSIVPNSIELTGRFRQYQLVYELEHRHVIGDRPGKVALVGFVSRGGMGRYEDAVALAEQTGSAASTASVRRFGTRPGVNVNAEQRLTSDISIFGRVGWADGSVEAYEFTDIDRTGSGGVSVSGRRWGRPTDSLGVATVINGISDAHRAYLAAGGLGILVGDGQLPNPGLEKIIEAYYRTPIRAWQITADYQLIVNPAFNRDRGPVSVIALRLRSEF